MTQSLRAFAALEEETEYESLWRPQVQIPAPILGGSQWLYNFTSKRSEALYWPLQA